MIWEVNISDPGRFTSTHGGLNRIVTYDFEACWGMPIENGAPSVLGSVHHPTGLCDLKASPRFELKRLGNSWRYQRKSADSEFDDFFRAERPEKGVGSVINFVPK